MKNCPSCKSDQIKKASLIHVEGLSVGAGVGASTGGLGVGVGVSTSGLAATCAPPKKDKDAFTKQTGHLMLLVFFVPLLFAYLAESSFAEVGFFWKVWAGLGVVLTGWLQFKFEKDHEASYQQAKADYDKTFMCLRCGTLYKPFD